MEEGSQLIQGVDEAVGLGDKGRHAPNSAHDQVILGQAACKKDSPCGKKVQALAARGLTTPHTIRSITGMKDRKGSVNAGDLGGVVDQSAESDSDNSSNKLGAYGMIEALGSDEDTEEELKDDGMIHSGLTDIYLPSYSEDVQRSPDTPPPLPASFIVNELLLLPASSRSAALLNPCAPSVSPVSLEEPCALVLASKSASVQKARAKTTKRLKGEKEAQRSLPKAVSKEDAMLMAVPAGAQNSYPPPRVKKGRSPPSSRKKNRSKNHDSYRGTIASNREDNANVKVVLDSLRRARRAKRIRLPLRLPRGLQSPQR
ncbi:hypothetical protein BDK51DRAFT_35079 [Blyttiomyces helicus]|uniref:Uncharacterized protein n=1 Tax=Blyttiomyces helicus TaxID=388810 RepID=A0A4P9WD95_9FUNG|nr:hypothetical protein BDK51DRAFT_35079 [Blyttiomyces helicus]|eukprot:RKO90504.1 hypothetical protein BDK51DRAFT_35079 [Blyttiomyces helicus]